MVKSWQKPIIIIGSAFTVVFIGLIVVLSLVPSQQFVFIGVVGNDKAYHVVAFFFLSFPLSFARPRLVIWVLLGVLAFGGSLELMQHLFGRNAEWGDFVADVIGAFFGAAIARQLGLWFFRTCDYNRSKENTVK